jgi:small GTP-binding protein
LNAKKFQIINYTEKPVCAINKILEIYLIMQRPEPVGHFPSELVAKVLIVGESGVGKTSLLTRFTDNLFSASVAPSMSKSSFLLFSCNSIGVDHKNKKVKVDGKEFKLQIWDTMGQEKYRAMTDMFYKNAKAVIVVFDLTNIESFQNVSNWIRHTKNKSGEDICKLVVGNKKDMEDRVATAEDVKELSEDLGVEIMEVSAKTGENVDAAFIKIAKDIKKKFFAKDDIKSDPIQKNIRIKRGSKDSPSVSGGCGC